MTSYLVLTIIGDDKPGLVEALSQIIADNSGNWLESSMSQLAGKFAGILRVSVSDEGADKLIAELDKLSNDLKINIERVSAVGSDKSQQTVSLDLVGNDRPGIVQEIFRALAGLFVNIEELSTQCVSAPMSSEALFKATAVLNVPDNLSLEALQEELERLTDDLIVEINLK
jgi:glycine cleavage system regulatory protein